MAGSTGNAASDKDALRDARAQRRAALKTVAPRHVLISSMKDEGPFILEWVAHHLTLGFDLIAIASNDCSDGSDQLLAALDHAGYIHHVPNVLAPGDIPQHAGYAAIRRDLGIDKADWLMMLDADEFLNVHVGGHTVADLTARADDSIDIIALNGMSFSDAPQINWQPGPICPSFPNRLALTHKANAALKSLTRQPSRFDGIHNHHMVGYRGDKPLVALRGDGSSRALDPGLPLWKQVRSAAAKPASFRLAQYNHYVVKSWDSFMLRSVRGRGAVAEMTPDKQRHTEAYFAERHQSDAPDASIARYAGAVAALMADMLQDPRIRRRQADCDRLYAAMAAPYRRG